MHQRPTWDAEEGVQDVIRKLTSMTNASDTRHVALEEQVAIFLYIIVTNLSNRKVAEHF